MRYVIKELMIAVSLGLIAASPLGVLVVVAARYVNTAQAQTAHAFYVAAANAGAVIGGERWL